MKLQRNGKFLSPDEIVQYVTRYKEETAASKKGRYSDLIKMVPESKYGLDYGCGWGAFSKIMVEKGNRIIGQDLGENEVEIARYVWGESDSLSFTAKNILEFPADEFDFVTSCQVIEHTHNPGSYLGNINRVLRTNGELIISVPNIVNPRFIAPLLSKKLETNLQRVNREILSDYVKMRDHIQGWDPLHFARLLGSVGFEVLHFLPSEGVPFPARLGPFKLPAYLFPKGRLKQYCYTMIFKARKAQPVSIGEFD